MDGKLIALTLVLVIVAVLCAWLVSTAVIGSQVAETGPTVQSKVMSLSMSIKEPVKPIENSVILSMSIVEPSALGGE